MSNMGVRGGSARQIYILLALVAVFYGGAAELGRKKLVVVKPTVRLPMTSITIKVPVDPSTGLWVRDQAEGGMGKDANLAAAGRDAPIEGVSSPMDMIDGGAVDRTIPPARADGAQEASGTTGGSASTLASLPAFDGSMGWASLAAGGPYCNVSSPTHPFIRASAPNFKVASRSLVPMPVAFDVPSTDVSLYAAFGYFSTLMAPPVSVASIEYRNKTALPLPGPYVPAITFLPSDTLTSPSVEQPLRSSIATPTATSCDPVSPAPLLLSSPSFLPLEPVPHCAYTYAINSSLPCGPWVTWASEVEGQLLDTESALLDYSGDEPALAAEPTMSERIWSHWRGVWERLRRFIRREGYTRPRRAAEGSGRIFARLIGVTGAAVLRRRRRRKGLPRGFLHSVRAELVRRLSLRGGNEQVAPVVAAEPEDAAKATRPALSSAAPPASETPRTQPSTPVPSPPSTPTASVDAQAVDGRVSPVLRLLHQILPLSSLRAASTPADVPAPNATAPSTPAFITPSNSVPEALDGPQQPSARTLASLLKDAVETAAKAMKETAEAVRKGDLLTYLARTCTAVGVIGSGGFGLLKKYQTPEGSLIAVKFQVVGNGITKALLENELQCNKALEHLKYSVPFLGHYIDAEGSAFSMDFISGPTLDKFMRQMLHGLSSPVGRIRDIMSELIDYVRALDGLDMVHRDIKPLNLMLSEQGLKVLDLGLAVRNAATTLKIVAGTYTFMAPDVILSSEAPSYESSASDLWSVGCTIFVMLTQLTAQPVESVYANDTLEHLESYFNLPSFLRAPFLTSLRAKMQRDVDHAKARVHSWVTHLGMDAGYAVTLLTMLDMQGPERLAVLDWDDAATTQHGAALVAKLLSEPPTGTVYAIGEEGEPIVLLDKSVEPSVAPAAPLDGVIMYVLNEDGEPVEMPIAVPAAPQPAFLAVPPGFEMMAPQLMAGPPPGL